MGERIAKARPKQYKHSDTATAEFFAEVGILIALVLGTCIVIGTAKQGFKIAFDRLCRAVNLKPRRVTGIFIAAGWVVFSACLASISLSALFRHCDQHRRASPDSFADGE